LLVFSVGCGAEQPRTEKVERVREAAIVATQAQKLVASDAQVNDCFGADLTRSGTTLVVGAAGFTALTGPKSAGAYVFTSQAGSWVESAKLVAQGIVAADAFGSAVAMDGDTVAVAAVTDDEPAAVNAGSAFVFLRAGTTWSQQAKLIASDPTPNQEFGSDLAIEGDTLVVGAQHNSGSAPGKAYVFKRTGTTWSELQKLDRPDPTNHDIYGSAVTIDGETIMVGAAFHPGTTVSQSGAVYVFRLGTGGLYSLEQKLVPNDPVANGEFGSDLALEGNRAVIGALRANNAGVATGAAYVFERTGTTWTQVQKLTASDGQNQDLFGIRLSLSSTRLLIGASLDDDKGTDAGSAYLFELSGGSWQQAAKLIASDGAGGDRFGAATLLTPDEVVVAGWSHNGFRGAGWVFDVQETVGSGCSSAGQCASGFCVDGVCCDSACGGGDPDDCQACSLAAGAAVSGTCGPRPDSADCDDGDLCTQTDSCQSGACVGGNAMVCTASDECHAVGQCDPVTGACSDPAVPDETVCSGGECVAGTCTPIEDAGADAEVDAGIGGSAGSGGSAVDAGSDAGKPGGSHGSGDEGGCGCRTASGQGSPVGLLGLLASVWLALRRRSRRN
jgi:MYXO-CTERM domain-containing protein